MIKATNATDLLQSTSPCEIVYSEKAWMKTILLVENRDLEVGWHGVVRRSESPNVFIVDDILIFPQKVTSTSTEPEDEDYVSWQDSLDAETFNKVRLYGHSHVNMSVAPSSTDMKYREDLLTDVDDFYIFQIFNKKGYISSHVYDVREGVRYENPNVNVTLERFHFATYDLCKVILDNIKLFEEVDVRDIQDGIEWFMNTESEFEDFVKEADEAIIECESVSNNTGFVWCSGCSSKDFLNKK